MTEMAGIKKCLSAKRTLNETARRRLNAESDLDTVGDEDAWLYDHIPPFKLDLEKILASKSLRRLADKTQVITDGQNPHIRSRLVHTMEVAKTAMIISELLGLNTALCLAIAYGHDIGHAPFGHLGERFISEVTGEDFRHEVFGVVLAQQIERKGRGLNLTHQVLDGIARHSRGSGELTVCGKATPEATVVMFADKIAYTWGDVNDLFMRTQLVMDDFPDLKEEVMWFGSGQRQRVEKTIKALCRESAEKGEVSFGTSEEAVRFNKLKKLMYTVYGRVNFLMFQSQGALYKVYDFLKKKVQGVEPAVAFALLCDHEVLALARKEKLEVEDLQGFSIAEIIPYLRDRIVKYDDPDLNW